MYSFSRQNHQYSSFWSRYSCIITVVFVLLVGWAWLTVAYYIQSMSGHLVVILAKQPYLFLNQQVVSESQSINMPTLASYTSWMEAKHTVTKLTLKEQEVHKVLNNIDMCMHGSNLHDVELTTMAKQNAEHFLFEYRKVIPMEHLTDYNSHCWKTNYSVTLSRNQTRVSGHISKIAFNSTLPKMWFGNSVKEELKYHFLDCFNSSKLCLPNLYLLGFEKCGSSFYWCIMSKVLNRPLNNFKVQIEKEPYFWTPINYNVSLVPTVQKLGGIYAPMFLRAVDPKYSSEIHKKITLIDGCPSTVIEYPKLQPKDPDMVNYCLYPSVLPQLFPDSKYLVIMRNPVEMMYSAFWWSISFPTPVYPHMDTLGQSVNFDHYKGPEVFHHRVVEKIEQFLDCMNYYCFEESQQKCTLFGDSNSSNYTVCIPQCIHWLTKCVANVTTTRAIAEAVLHRGIYYTHVLKWLHVVPKDRIHFITIEGLSSNIYSTVKQTYEFIHNGEQLPLSEGTVRNISRLCKVNTNRVNYKSNPALWMRNDTRHILEEFFQPFNKMLSDLLEDKQFLWNDH